VQENRRLDRRTDRAVPRRHHSDRLDRRRLDHEVRPVPVHVLADVLERAATDLDLHPRGRRAPVERARGAAQERILIEIATKIEIDVESIKTMVAKLASDDNTP